MVEIECCKRLLTGGLSKVRGTHPQAGVDKPVEEVDN
jgi:hypothetical protein